MNNEHAVTVEYNGTVVTGTLQDSLSVPVYDESGVLMYILHTFVFRTGESPNATPLRH